MSRYDNSSPERPNNDQIKSALLEFVNDEPVLEDIVQQLPDDLADQIFDIFTNNSEVDERLRGYLFEQLVLIEMKNRNEDQFEHDEDCTQIEKELMLILNQPAKYGIRLKDNISFRVPDLSHIRVLKTDDLHYQFEVLELGEVKLGKLNDRALQQLSVFKIILEDVIYQINQIGLLHEPQNFFPNMLIADKIKMHGISISSAFQLALIVANDRDLDDHRTFVQDELLSQFEQISSTNDLRVEKSQFSIDQIGKMGRKVRLLFNK